MAVGLVISHRILYFYFDWQLTKTKPPYLQLNYLKFLTLIILKEMKGYDRANKQARGDKVRFESGMTSEQKYNSIAESVLSKMQYGLSKQVSGCAMHPKISKKCRKCQQLQKVEPLHQQQQLVLLQTFPQIIKINTNNTKSHFNQKLQLNIENSYLYKNMLKNINNVKQLANSLTSDQISIQTFMPGSTQNATPFFSHLYRLAELRPTKEQISIMLKANNVNVRCLALLYLRIFVDPTIVYACISTSFQDNKLLSVETIGQYAMRLLDEERLDHGGFRLPRLPIKIQNAITKKINQIKEERQQQFQRERSRQKERHRRRIEEQQYRNKNKRSSSNSSFSSSSSSSSSSKNSFQNKKEKQQKGITPKMSLKQRIKLIEEKKEAEERRKSLLESYNPVKADTLLNEAQQQQGSQSDSVQKFDMG